MISSIDNNMVKKYGMRIVLTIIFLILFLFFFAPMFNGIINVGNCFGALLSGIAAAAFAFPKLSGSIGSWLWERTWGKVIAAGLSCMLAVGIILGAVISGLMLKEMNDNPKDENTTLVVLGCQMKESGPSLMLRRRLDAAYNYLIDHENVKVIVSGGKGVDEPVSEASGMRDYLISSGISPDRIYIEDRSKNTEENIAFSKEIIERENLCGDITIVTDGYHQLRADIFAKRQGIRSYNISAPTSAWLVPTYWVREWFGVIYYLTLGSE